MPCRPVKVEVQKDGPPDGPGARLLDSNDINAFLDHLVWHVVPMPSPNVPTCAPAGRQP